MLEYRHECDSVLRQASRARPLLSASRDGVWHVEPPLNMSVLLLWLATLLVSQGCLALSPEAAARNVILRTVGAQAADQFEFTIVETCDGGRSSGESDMGFDGDV